MKNPTNVTYSINGEEYELTQSEDWKYGTIGFKRLKKSAKNRGVPFQIESFKDLLLFWIMNPDTCYWCEYTVNEFQDFHIKIKNCKINSFPVLKLKKVLCDYNSKYLTFDRRNSDEGYLISNLVKSCPLCNFIRGSFLSEEEYKPIARRVINRVMELIQ